MRKSGRVAECVCLENRRPARVRGFESYLFRTFLSSHFGKTGWSGSDITKDGKTLEHSWFVGWIEKDDSFYPFAYLIRDKKINLDQRIPRVKQLLVESNIMIEVFSTNLAKIFFKTA